MPKDIHVLIIEDDIYARDLIALLLNRDWRTRIVGELGSLAEVQRAFQESISKVDAMIADTEYPDDPEWIFRVAEIAKKSSQSPIVVTTATKVDSTTLRKAIKGGFGGYMVKREVGYAVATAVAEAVKNKRWIITKSVYQVALRQRIDLPANTVILDGTKPVASLTPREEEVARLAILFNLAHRDLSDELLIRSDQIAKYVSSVYTKIGLDDILAGEISPDYFFQDKVVLQHFNRILSRVTGKKRKKTSDMATLAFHLLTVPEIREVI